MKKIEAKKQLKPLSTGLKFSDATEQTTTAVQSDFNETDISSLAYIQNKPTQVFLRYKWFPNGV
jgi:hypothetical protein